MIVERLLIALLLVLLASGAYLAFKQAHVRRLGRLRAVTGQPTLLYFQSDQCAACPMQARYLEQLGQAWAGRLSIQKVDADTEPEEAARYGVFTLPTTILVDEAGVVRQINYGLTHTSRLSQQVAKL
jgi:thioredoxin 1